MSIKERERVDEIKKFIIDAIEKRVFVSFIKKHCSEQKNFADPDAPIFKVSLLSFYENYINLNNIIAGHGKCFNDLDEAKNFLDKIYINLIKFIDNYINETKCFYEILTVSNLNDINEDMLSFNFEQYLKKERIELSFNYSDLYIATKLSFNVKE